MPAPTTPPDDARLHAWLDDELDAAARAEVDAWLRTHPEDARRVQRWADDRDALRAALAPDLDEPLPEAWRQRLQAPAPRRAPAWALAAGVALCAGLAGFAAGRWGADAGPTATAWAQRAAAAHAVYVPEQRHPVEVAVRDAAGQRLPAQEQHLAAWLTRRLGLPVRLFDLQAQGFGLVGGRLLPDGDRPGAQLMYEDAGGRRVTVYLRRPDAPGEVTFRHEQHGELGQFYWVEDGAGYALAGALPKAELLVLAQAIHAQGGGGALGDNPAHGPR